ncbi:MAG: hypothetical protein [Circular genetic element sp.]|nr:MAG: hypothetical protein [Circular genetic element sp.]
MPKIEPAVKTLRFEVTAAVGQYQYISLSQCASIVNRRFYRDGLNWAVGGFTVIGGGAGSGFITVNRLPETWVLSNAWTKAFKAWQRQQNEVMADGTQESVKARFNDFKVYMDQAHYDATSRPTGSNLLPNGTAGIAYPAGEWDYSQIVVPNYGAPGSNWEPYMQMIGGAPPVTIPPSFGLIQAYANSRSTPQTPDPAVPGGVVGLDNVFRSMFDVGDNNTDVLNNVVGKNNDLPYAQDDYPGEGIDQAEFVASIRLANTQSQTQVAGSSFPCGLIQLDTSLLEGSVQFIVHLVPGDHRGYLAQSMLEM